MRKQIVEKAHYQPLTPYLTDREIRNLQNILDKQSVENTRFLAEIFGGEIRLKIIYLLGLKNSLCVKDIADILKSKVSGISHQLRLLREARLVSTHKKRRVVYYSLSAKLPKLAKATLEAVISS